MPTGSAVDEQDADLPPPGSRWGAGAQSVLPYLTKSLQSKPANPLEREPKPRAEGNPVFAHWQRPRSP